MRRGLLGLGLLVLLGCSPSSADTVSYRCVETGTTAQPDAKGVMIVIIDPLLGEMTAEHYSGQTLRNRTIYQIEQMNEAIIRGRNVGRRAALVLELNRLTGRVSETIGSDEPTYYKCEPSGSVI